MSLWTVLTLQVKQLFKLRFRIYLLNLMCCLPEILNLITCSNLSYHVHNVRYYSKQVDVQSLHKIKISYHRLSVLYLKHKLYLNTQIKKDNVRTKRDESKLLSFYTIIIHIFVLKSSPLSGKVHN